MSNPKILHLTIKKKWFDLILSGEKKEEYREIKDYWTTRLVGKKYDLIRFKNGYAKDAPSFDIELLTKRIGYGKAKWGAQAGKQYFVLSLGKILIKQQEGE